MLKNFVDDYTYKEPGKSIGTLTTEGKAPIKELIK
jgi:hypothetical protein